MTEYMQISSIGVSKESQLRAAKILGVLSEGCQHFRTADSENFFEYSHRIMRERRESLSIALQGLVAWSPNTALEVWKCSASLQEEKSSLNNI